MSTYGKDNDSNRVKNQWKIPISFQTKTFRNLEVSSYFINDENGQHISLI